jgi:hypothetical protein
LRHTVHKNSSKVHILIDKKNRKGYCSKDRRAIASKLSLTEGQLKYRGNKNSYDETADYLYISDGEVVKGGRGGLRTKKNN